MVSQPIRQVVLLSVVTALACTDHTAVDGPRSEAIALVRLRAQPTSFLESSDLRTPLRVVVRDEAEWRAIWSRLWHPRADAPPLPIVDFSREMVILAAAGEVASSGYDILVDSASLQDDRVQVRVRSIRPGAECGVRWVIMHPVDVARISRTQLPVVFDEQSEVRDCP
jgi:hypothetical protein